MTILNRPAMLLAVATAAIATILCLQQTSVTADQPPAPTTASVDDIGKNLILIGRLQKPLGTMMTVRGRWRLPEGVAKDNSPRFTVSHVDGKQLAEPIEFHIGQFDVFMKDGTTATPPHDRQKELDGVEWSLRAYENGSVILTPEEFWKTVAPMAMPGFLALPFSSQVVGVIQP